MSTECVSSRKLVTNPRKNKIVTGHCMIRYNDKSKEFGNFLALALYMDSNERSVSFECNLSNGFLKLEKNLIITEIKCKIKTGQFCKAKIITLLYKTKKRWKKTKCRKSRTSSENVPIGYYIIAPVDMSESWHASSCSQTRFPCK